MRQPRVDAHAQIHSRHECCRLAEGTLSGEVVEVGRGRWRQRCRQLPMGDEIGLRATEHDLTAAVFDQPADHLGHPVKRPVAFLVGRSWCQEDSRPHQRQAGDQPIGFRTSVGRHPVFVMAIVDLDAVGPQQIEREFHLMPFFVIGNPAREQQPPPILRRTHPMRNAGQPGEEAGRERPLEDIGAVIPLRAEPARGGDHVGQRPRHDFVDPLWSLPDDELIFVGTVGEDLPCARFHQHVDHRVRKPPPQVSQEGDRQDRIADVAIADHENPGRIGHE